MKIVQWPQNQGIAPVALRGIVDPSKSLHVGWVRHVQLLRTVNIMIRLHFLCRQTIDLHCQVRYHVLWQKERRISDESIVFLFP